MRLLDSASLLAGAASLDVQPGQYGALVLRVAGTTAAADASATDVGLITGSWRGRPMASLRFTDLQSCNAMELGYVEVDNTTPFNYTAAMLSSRSGDGNVFDVAKADNMHIDVNLSGAAGIAGAAWTGGTIKLYGVPAEGPQNYMPQLFTHQLSIADGTFEIVDLPYENVSHLYVLTTTNLAEVQLAVDGETLVQVDVPAMQAWSNMDARLEAAFTTGFVINLHRSGAVSENMNDSILLRASASGGAAAPIIIASALDYTPDVSARSKAFVSQKAQTKFARKQQLGKGRPLRVVQSIQ